MRKVKDAKDLSTNELIYFKGHAKATYMSDGTTVEDAINNIEIGTGADLSDYATKEELNSINQVSWSILEYSFKATVIGEVLEVYNASYKNEILEIKGAKVDNETLIFN